LIRRFDRKFKPDRTSSEGGGSHRLAHSLTRRLQELDDSVGMRMSWRQERLRLVLHRRPSRDAHGDFACFHRDMISVRRRPKEDRDLAPGIDDCAPSRLGRTLPRRWA
jgi:hypothetical protein